MEPVGESVEDYRQWGRSWARVRRRAAVRVAVIVLCGVAVLVVSAVLAPRASLWSRLHTVRAAKADLQDCCGAMNAGWSGSCLTGRLDAAAASVRADRQGAVAAAAAAALASRMPSYVPNDVDSRVRRELWECPELALYVERDWRALEDPDPEVRAAAESLALRARPRGAR